MGQQTESRGNAPKGAATKDVSGGGVAEDARLLARALAGAYAAMALEPTHAMVPLLTRYLGAETVEALAALSEPQS